MLQVGSRLRSLLLSIGSGVLLWLCWPTLSTTIIVFFAFVPLLMLEKELHQTNKKGFWRYSLLSMLIWNAPTTWWIWHASPGGAVFAIVANSLLMTVPLLFYAKTKRIYGNRLGYISLIVYWVGFEYLHLNWDISWPWLTLGNVFALKHWWVQWYEYTGILGGSIWVLIANLITFHVLNNPSKKITITALKIIAVIAIPIGISTLIWENVDETGKEIEVISVQPNIDPYGEKFSVPVQDQFDKMISLSQQKMKEGKEADLILWPETAVQRENSQNREDLMAENDYYLSIKEMIKGTKTCALVGIESWRKVPLDSDPAYTKFSTVGAYQAYNAGLWVDSLSPQIYHKSKFVPGVESLPFPRVLGFILKIINFSQMGSYAPQENRPVFSTSKGVKVAPVICYESIYGDFLGKYSCEGADIYAVITNDGWWEDTQGYRHHNLYAKLRAIEMRRPVVRSANTGISSYITIKGDIIKQVGWWKEAVLKESVITSTKLTFYAKYGDYLGRIAAFMAVVFALSTFVRKKTEIQ